MNLKDECLVVPVVVSADNNLGTDGRYDYNEIMEGSRRAGPEVVIPLCIDIGGSARPGWFVIRNGQYVQSLLFDTMNLNRPDYLREFLKWSMPVTGGFHALILGGHANGRRFGKDNTKETGVLQRGISANEVVNVLSQTNSRPAFIGCDGCESASIPMWSSLQVSGCEVFAGTGTKIDGCGMDYTTFFSGLSKKSTAEDIARQFVHSYDKELVHQNKRRVVAHKNINEIVTFSTQLLSKLGPEHQDAIASLYEDKKTNSIDLFDISQISPDPHDIYTARKLVNHSRIVEIGCEDKAGINLWVDREAEFGESHVRNLRRDVYMPEEYYHALLKINSSRNFLYKLLGRVL